MVFYSIVSFAQVKTNNLILFYPFNGNSIDLAGDSLNATVNGASLIKDRFGNVASAYYFDGINDYLEIPDTTALQPSFPFSLSLWVNIDTILPVTVSLYNSCQVVNNLSGFALEYDSNGVVKAFFADAAGTDSTHYKARVSVDSLKPNKWYNIVASFYSATEIKLFINGTEQQGVYQGLATSMVYSSNPGNLGRKVNITGNSYHSGKIDDIRLFNDSLTFLDIQYLNYESACINKITILDTVTVLDTIVVLDTLTMFDSIAVINYISTQDTMFVDLATNTETIKVYTMPNKTTLLIDFGNNLPNMGGYSINITNSFGQQIYFQQVNTTVKSVNLMSLGGLGLYHINFLNNLGTLVSTKTLVLN